MLRKEKDVEIRAFLRNRTHPICDACIEKNLKYGTDVANHSTRDFKKLGIIEREDGMCPECRDIRLVNSRTALT